MDILALYESDQRRIYNKKRRERELRKNLLLGITSAILIVALSIAFGSILSLAGADDAEHAIKYYGSIEIQYGDTLELIAERFMDGEHYDSIDAYIKEVMKINNLRDDRIVAGRHIVVPYYATELR